MKVLLLTALVVVSCVVAAPQDYHETLDDEFDFSALAVDQIRDAALCLCDDGACSDLFNSYKQHMAVAIPEACKRCKPSHKKIALVFFDRLQKELPEEVMKCAAKYDPQGKYFQAFYNSLKSA